MKTIACIFAALLAGCATSGTQMQAECEARLSAFQDIYHCTHDAVLARNPGIMKDARAKLYLLRGEQLAQEVEAGRMRSLDAKVAWQRLYVDLKTAHDQEVMAAIATMPRPVSPPPVPVPVPVPAPSVSCTSNRLGNTVHTNCN